MVTEAESNLMMLLPKRFASLVNGSPFHKWLEGNVTEAQPGRVVFEYLVREEMCNSTGTMHGGIMAAIMDDLFGVAAMTCEDVDAINTINLNFHFLSPVRIHERIVAEAKVVRLGKRIIHTTAELRNSSGNAVASGTADLLVIATR